MARLAVRLVPGVMMSGARMVSSAASQFTSIATLQSTSLATLSFAVLASVVASSLSAAALRLAFVQYCVMLLLLYVKTMFPRALRPAIVYPSPSQVIPVTATMAVRSKLVAPPFAVQLSRT